MGEFLNRGPAAFKSAVNSDIYVDKTGLIEYCNRVINTEQRYMCVSRPRRFGKSIAAAMIQAYYENGIDTESLFTDYAISKNQNWKLHLNKYDVFRIDVAGVFTNRKSPEATLDFIEAKMVNDIYEAFPDLDRKDGMTPADAMLAVNKRYSKQFIVIIDEWDYFFREDCTDSIQKRYIQFLRAMFKDDRSKDFLAIAYITGILPIKQYSSESALNNFREYTMTGPKRLAEYIGFTDKEVKALCDRYDMDYDQAMQWYDGYSFGRVKHICGPNSIVNAMLDGEYANYWSKTVAFSSLSTYITMNFDGLRDAIVSMLCGNHERVDITGYENDMNSIYTKDDVLTVLIHLGYLAYDAENKEAYIPNKEVWEIFENNLKKTNWNEVIKAVNDSEALLKSTLSGDADVVAKAIDECHTQNFSSLKYNDENSLASCVILAYYTAKKDYHIIRELPSGYGFADMVFIPKIPGSKPALIVELKWNNDVQTAIDQIKQKKYPETIRDFSGDILLVGISYDKNNKDSGHSCIIERLVV